MRKRNIILISYILIGILLFCFLMLAFPIDGYYKSINTAELHEKTFLTKSTRVTIAEFNESNFDFRVNDKGELYILQIAKKITGNGTSYKVVQSKGYSLEKAIEYLDSTNSVMWTRLSLSQLNHNSVAIDWCIIRNEADLGYDSNIQKVNIIYNDTEFTLLYKISNRE